MTDDKKLEEPKPKHLVLQEMNAVIYKYDPLESRSPRAEEYEGEALSILARFNESQLQFAEDENDAIDAARNIVDETFLHWLGGQENFEIETDIMNNMTLELLHVYVSAYPEPSPNDLDPDDVPIHVIMPNKDEEVQEEEPLPPPVDENDEQFIG